MIISWLQSILPEEMFKTFCKVAFPIYKAANRQLYLLKGIVLYSVFDLKHWNMVKKIYSIMPYTLVGVGGLEATYRIAEEVNKRKIEGDFVELGVARGGCAALMGRVLFDSDELNRVNRKLWLFDSYEGLPDPTEDDFDSALGTGTGDHVRPLPKGSCLGTLDEVKSLMFEIRGFPKDNVIFVKGWFQDTIPQKRSNIKEISILRIDGDWYESTKCCLDGLYDKVSQGGFVIIDDYQSCYGCKKAVDEFIANRQMRIDIKLDGRGGCYFKKTA